MLWLLIFLGLVIHSEVIVVNVVDNSFVRWIYDTFCCILMMEKNMENKTVYVVGDKFELFSQNSSVLKIKTLEDRLSKGDYVPDRGTLYVLSQGISQDRLNCIVSKVKAKGIDRFFAFPKSPLAGKLLSHKHQQQNIMISDPRQISENEFQLELRLDENCADMADHCTGQHIQGMVLIESARQAFLAVTEKYFVNQKIKYYFVIDSFNINYIGFIYPLGVNIYYRINKSKTKNQNRMSFSVTMEISQIGGLIGCQVDVEFTAFESSVIEKIEAKQARDSISNARSVLTQKESKVFSEDVVSS